MRLVLAVLMAAALTIGPAKAQQAASVVDQWRFFATIDSKAALTLIEENHPGAQPGIADTAFHERIALAKRHLAERLPRVTDFAGYNAVMEGLAADFRDGHIWSRSLAKPQFVEWTGMVIDRKGGAFVVASQLPVPGKPDLVGARLISCDGVDAETWAKARVGLFHADASIEAQLASSAPWLLLDEGNPFLARPKACVFQQPGSSPQEITLFWGRGSTDVVEEAVAKASDHLNAGLGVDAVGSGYWIRLGSLRSEAGDLAAAIERDQQRLRAAPYVIVDLRGNGGGDSTYATRIAAALVGVKRVQAAETMPSSCSGTFWRASPGNIAARVARRAQIADGADPQDLADYDNTTKAMQTALAVGQPFAPALPQCVNKAHSVGPVTAAKLPPSLMTGKLVIVTDRACFSSCLLAVDTFRHVGALQIGEATDLSTRYMEVRTVTLPSGLRNFSTLQKVAVGAGDFGPYQPDRIFPGIMSDTAALQQWAMTIVEP